MQAFYDCTSQDVNPGGARKVFHGGRDNTDLGLGEGSAGNLLLGSALSIVVYPAPDKASLEVFEPLPRQTGNRKVHRRPHSLWGQVGKTGHEEQPLEIDAPQKRAVIFGLIPGVGHQINDGIIGACKNLLDTLTLDQTDAVRRADPGAIGQDHGITIHRDELLEHVSSGAGKRCHHGTLFRDESIEKGRLAGVGTACEKHPQGMANAKGAAGSAQKIKKIGLHLRDATFLQERESTLKPP
jgi:hypothetical protein